MVFIIKPLVTEKMNQITEKSAKDINVRRKGETTTKPGQPRYGFIVKPEATKLDVKHEVESLYGVKVVSVNTAKYAGKRMSRYTKKGLVRGQHNAFKKAFVTLKNGESIDFFSNI